MLGWLKSSPRPTRQQLLSSVPHKNVLVKETAMAEGLRLTAPLRPNRLREVLGARAGEKSFELDQLGGFTWRSIDGKRNIEGLIRLFAEEQRVSLREADVSVVAFLKMLAQRNLIGLVTPRDE